MRWGRGMKKLVENGQFYEGGQNGFLGYSEGRTWSGEGMSVTYSGVSEYWLQEYMGFLAM